MKWVDFTVEKNMFFLFRVISLGINGSWGWPREKRAFGNKETFKARGPSNVPISTGLLNAVKYAAMNEKEELKKARDEKEKAEKEALGEEKARKRKREEDESMQKWAEARLELDSNIKACKDYIS